MNFEKEGIVSAWYSTTDYSSIPDSYFEEDEQGLDRWAKNFDISQYNPDNLETNGCEKGVSSIRNIIAPCSWSSSYGDAIIKKIEKMGDKQISWLILVFDFEYRAKKTHLFEDEYVHFVGCFPYDMEAANLA
ncbi:immunity 22 family protein [Amphritea sp. 1_MG-2023]|uniref:immunity 22 family protein n=1 Tax=Amphritea sp. 1_MG-2023 TaxID=3062670 RepID=UPI0026E3E1F4|nr:immunity 22 family protein [Amphritea sp. 1_MG-2023]MDO6562264.1 immunity 22 family protein [Amphritea sp. 1_MG-2023]